MRTTHKEFILSKPNRVFVPGEGAHPGRSGIAKVTLWALVGRSPGRPPFPFQNPFESPVCVRPSQLPQVSGDSRKQEGVGAETPKTKAAT